MSAGPLRVALETQLCEWLMHNVHACLIISSLQLLLREAVELEHEADGQGDASHPPFPVSLTDMLLASGHGP